MFRLIPAPLHRAILRGAHAVRIRWWRLRRPMLESCSVIATDIEDRLLLVRLSYGSGAWSFPTGGIRASEAPEAAAARELREETGCEACALTFLGLQEEVLHGARNLMHVFATRIASEPVADRREVVEVRMFPAHSLPEPLSAMTRRRLALWQGRS